MKPAKPHRLLARLTRKKIALVVVGGIILLAVLIIGGGWLLGQHLNNSYRTQLSDYAATADNQLTEAAHKIQQALTQNDTAKTVEALSQFKETLTSQAKALPAPPSFFGVIGAQSEIQQAREAVTARLSQCKDTISKVSALLMYERRVTDTLDKLGSQSGQDAAAQQALAASWQTAVKEWEELEVPATVQEAHKQLLAAARDVHAQLAALPELFTAQDYDGFINVHNKIRDSITQLRGVNTAIHAAALALDRALAKDYRALQMALEDLSS